MTHPAADVPAHASPAATPPDAGRLGLLEAVFRRAPTFLHVLRGPEFVFELANPAYYQLVGHRDLIGRPAFEALPEAAAGGFPERLARVMATREPFVGRELPVTLARTPGAAPEERLIDLVYLPLVEPDGTCERVLGHGTDVTDQVHTRRQSEAALDAERCRLADIIRLAPAFMAVLRGADHVITLTNAGFDALVGGRDVRGRPVAEALPEAAAQGFVALLDRVLAMGEPFVGREVPYERPDAAGAEDVRAVDFVYQALTEADGTRSGVFVHGVDVTAQVRARREVERLLAVSEAARGDAEAAAQQLQEQAAELEMQAEELQATAAHLEEQVEAADRAAAALRHSEARYALAARATFNAIWDWDLATDALAWNEGLHTLFGHPPDAVPAGSTPEGIRFWYDHIHPDDRDRVVAGTHRVIDDPAGGTAWQDEYRFRRGDGTYAAVVDRGYVGRGAAGEPLRMIGAMQDVTAARAAEAERERLLAESDEARRAAEAARAEADRANRAKSEFLSTMSHELRTPLNAIGGYTQLLELGIAGPTTPEQRDYLARLTASGQHLLGLVNDVLDLAKVDAGEMRVARDPATTEDAVTAALDLVRPLGDARGVRVVDGTPDVSTPYVGDEHRVRQVLVNLLSNGVKFTGPGGRVTVSCGRPAEAPPAVRVHGGGPWAYVRVEDTGVGIAPEAQAAVFEPFRQVEPAASGVYTRTKGGTGLGLAISRRLARLMGGDLTLESTPGVGSAFTLWLPSPGLASPGGAERGAEGAGETAAARGVRAPRDTPGVVRGLGELGALLRRQVDALVTAYADRLRAEPGVPLARAMRQAELEDHIVTALADLAQTLVIVGEAGTAETGLLSDSIAINRVVAEQHGVRRHAQGWDLAALRRDYAVFGEVIARAVRAEARAGAADAEAALGILLGLVEQSEARAVVAWRAARAVGGDGTGEPSTGTG